MRIVRLLAILPWFAILFTSISAIVLFVASRRRVVPATSTEARREDEVEEVKEREKGGYDVREREKGEDEKGRV